jgi:hypothetical protein
MFENINLFCCCCCCCCGVSNEEALVIVDGGIEVEGVVNKEEVFMVEDSFAESINPLLVFK